MKDVKRTILCFTMVAVFFVIYFTLPAQETISKRMEEFEKKLPRLSGLEKVIVLGELSSLARSVSAARALEYGLQCLDAAKELKDPAEEAYGCNVVASAYTVQGNIKKALEYFKRSLNIYDELGNKPGSAAVLKNLGIIYRRMGSFEKALESYRKSMRLNEEIGREKEAAHALKQIGDVYGFMGELRRAQECLLEALVRVEKTKDVPLICATRSSIGNIYLELDQPGEALVYFKEALEGAEGIGDKFGTASISMNAGVAYQDLKQYSRAGEYFFKALKLFEEMNSRMDQLELLENIGQNYEFLDDLDSALKYYGKALELDKAGGAKSSTAEVLMNVGNVYRKKKDYENSRQYLEKALRLARKLKAKSIVADVYGAMSQLYADQKNHPKALEFHRRYHDTKQEVINEDSVKQINELQAKYQSEKKAREMDVLKKDYEIQALKLGKVSITRNAFILGFILISIILGLLFKKFLYLFAFWKKQKYMGRFRLMDKIAAGAMGTVYKAHALRDKNDVAAVKVLKDELFSDDKQKDRFRQEAAIIDKLEHPHIVRIFERGESRDSLFIAMEFLEGQTLETKILNHGPLNIAECLHIMKQVAETITFIHEGKIIHRDLKPGNIMLVRRGDDPHFVKLLDFGLAKMEVHNRLTQSGSYVGTLEYIAPEQILHSQSVPGNDIFSMGVTFYRMLTARGPFPGNTVIEVMRGVVGKEPPDIPGAGPDRPEELKALVRNMLEKDPDRRPTATAVRRELGEIAAS